MYDLISNIINHVWQTGTNVNSTEQQTLYYICGSLIIIFAVVFIDLLYRIFRHFWR